MNDTNNVTVGSGAQLIGSRKGAKKGSAVGGRNGRSDEATGETRGGNKGEYISHEKFSIVF
jgi:hypothetical protein